MENCLEEEDCFKHLWLHVTVDGGVDVGERCGGELIKCFDVDPLE